MKITFPLVDHFPVLNLKPAALSQKPAINYGAFCYGNLSQDRLTLSTQAQQGSTGAFYTLNSQRILNLQFSEAEKAWLSEEAKTILTERQQSIYLIIKTDLTAIPSGKYHEYKMASLSQLLAPKFYLDPKTLLLDISTVFHQMVQWGELVTDGNSNYRRTKYFSCGVPQEIKNEHEELTTAISNLSEKAKALSVLAKKAYLFIVQDSEMILHQQLPWKKYTQHSISKDSSIQDFQAISQALRLLQQEGRLKRGEGLTGSVYSLNTPDIVLLKQVDQCITVIHKQMGKFTNSDILYGVHSFGAPLPVAATFVNAIHALKEKLKVDNSIKNRPQYELLEKPFLFSTAQEALYNKTREQLDAFHKAYLKLPEGRALRLQPECLKEGIRISAEKANIVYQALCNEGRLRTVAIQDKSYYFSIHGVLPPEVSPMMDYVMDSVNNHGALGITLETLKTHKPYGSLEKSLQRLTSNGYLSVVTEEKYTTREQGKKGTVTTYYPTEKWDF